MKINRIDHISINVHNLYEAKTFFVDLGLEVQAEWELDGEQLDRIVGLNGVKTSCVGLGMPGGEAWIELVNFNAPPDEKGIQPSFANTLGIRHICFNVEDLDAIISKLKKRGTEIFSEIEQYEDSYKLCYVRGPEGIILELAEKIR
ncbi:VOC family protein [Falsibacillus pallidus]|uniref:Catechol 2,3-dioxygenase-like lactoylglutathione lyase family enzyme n=1 Tax=Falsibacillus pallidus TaxID=493781 RepID=A0A370G2F5_9BACI|nr:VOC family protein [Falsibacillus pallidus]RDI38047.1 catechol 2,3-dioxygenase-like lactoylglutathione lyase family enzyme [Falsibacillus pallidus]